MKTNVRRFFALLLTLAMVLPMAVPMLPVGASAAEQAEGVVFTDSFDYTAFAYKTLYDSGIWQAENKAGGGSVNRSQPLVEDGVMKLSVGMSAQFDWLNIPDFSFDAAKTYTMQFDVTVTSFGDDSASLRRELYVAPGGYYNQVELRSDNGSKCIRTGGNYTGTKDVEYLLNTRYTVILVWDPTNQMITSTLKNGDTVVSTGSRTGSGYANADSHCAHWVMRCEDGAVEIDNFSWSDGTNTYTEDFAYPSADQCMAAAGYWQTETTTGFTNSTAPELVDGVVKMDTMDSIQFNWTKLVEYDVNTAYTFEFDFKVTDAGNGNAWGGVAAATRALYVAPGGYYNQIELINATSSIRAGGTLVPYDENVYLNKDLHAKMVLEGTTITSTIYDASGNVLATGSRTSTDYADMTVRDGAMNYLAFRCEDGAVELDNFKLSAKVVAEEITTDLQIGENQRAVYSCKLQYAADDMPKVKLNGTQIFALANGGMSVCGCQVAGTYPAGVYGIRVDVNPVQHMVSLEITLPDGGIVRRGLYSIISGTEGAYAVGTLAQDDAYITDIAVQQYDVTVNDYTLVTTEPVYEGFNANVYSLVTSFSDPCTTRSFAWTALASYVGTDAMAIRYRVSGTEEWTVVDAVKEIEGVEIADEDYFKADIEGLTADTTYEYQYGKKDSADASDWSAVYTFKTSPENVEEFSFIAIGDSQGNSWNGTDNLDYMFTEAAIQESMEDGNAAFIMHAGDVVQSGQVKELWNMYFKTLGQYASSVPHFAAIGNHDAIKVSGDNAEFFFDLHFSHPNNGGTAALDTTYTSQITGAHLSALAQDADETIYSYNYGNAHFVVLNSGNYSSEDQLLLEAQRAWLKADLEANADAKWTIVMVHEPVYHRLGGNESRPWLYDVIEGYGVDLMIQGHSHLVTRTYPMKDGKIVTKENPDVIRQGTGTVYTTIGSTTNWHDGLGNNMEEIMLIKTPALEQATYTTVTVNDEKLEMTVKQLDGLVLDHFVIEAEAPEEISSGYASSSKWSENNIAEKAFDNDANTRWIASVWASKGTEWICTLFDEYGIVDSVQIVEYGHRIGAYEIQYLDENNTWITCYTGTLNETCDKSGSTITHPVISLDQPVTCKGIRFNVLGGSDASPGMCEFKLFCSGIPLTDGQIRSGYYASSDDGNPVKHAFDAVDTTRWSASASEDQWICAMYDDKFTMDSVEIIDAWGRLTSFEIQYFDENGTWQTCASRTGESTGADVTHQLSFDPVTTTGIRLYMPSTPGWPSIYELKMFYEGVQLVDGRINEGFYVSTNDGNTADKAFDNDPATRWSASAEKDQWIVASYENKFTFDSVEILEFWDRMNAFEIQYLDENGIWQTCASKTINTEDTGIDTSHALSFDPVTTNAVRLYIPDALGWPSIYEVKLFYTGIQVVNGQLEKGSYASSIWSDSNSADMAFDSDASTQWISKAWASKGTEWIYRTFQEDVTFDSIQIIEKGRRIGAYELQYLDENGAWTTCYTGTLNETCDKTGSAVTHPVISLGKSVTGKGIRFNILGGSDASPGMFEFKLLYAGFELEDGMINGKYHSSSKWSENNIAEKAFDNDANTRWIASVWASKGTEWICTLFDEYGIVDSVQIVEYGHRIGAYEIQYLDENSTWTTCYTGTLNETCDKTGTATTHPVIYFDQAVKCKGIRFNILGGSDASPGMIEFKMFYTGIPLTDGQIHSGYYASTDFSSDYDAGKAFDNDPATRWAAIASENQWIVASYENKFTFDSVEILEFWDRMNAFQLQYLDDNGVWQTCASKTIDTEDTGIDTSHALSFDPVTTNAVRLYIPDAPGWPSIYEVKLSYTGIQIVDGQLEKGCYASSQWSDSNSADMAFDSDVSTSWIANAWSSKGTEWVGKIFDEYVDIDEIHIIERGHRIGAYEIQYIDKTGAWKTCYTGTLNETCDKTGTAVTHPAISLGKPITCKGIRLAILGGSDASPGLFDFKTIYFDIPVSDGKIDNGYYSSTNDGNTADKAFDNDPATRWSACAVENQWICTFFDKAVTIDSVEILEFWSRMTSFEIQYIDENKQWKTCASKTTDAANTATDTIHQLSFDPVTTTGMRLYIHDAPGWASIYEFKMFYTGIQVIDGKIPGGCYSSSSFEDCDASLAFDYKLDTRWSASAEKDQWISAFYDDAITFDAITIKEFWDRMNAFQIQYYDENGVWQTIASKTIETEDTGVDATHSLSFDDITTNGIRVFIPDAPGWPSIYEVQIFHNGYAWIDVEKKPSDYSIAVIPDQQCLTDWQPDMLYGMYQWISDNIEKENMQMVINVGDITNNNSALHWERSKYAYDLLQNKVPYIAVPGNHDYGASFRDTSNMNTYFPLSMFKEMATYGGSYTEDNNLPDNVSNTWQAFEINGNKYLILALEFGPRDSVLTWASNVVATHPNHQVIVVTHAYMNSDGTLLDGTDPFLPSSYTSLIQEDQEAPNDPDAIWEKFVQNHENIIMVLSGHIGYRNIVMRTDTGVHGNEVKQILIDAQNEDPRLDMVAMLNFSNEGQDVEVTYYCPSKGKYMNYENQYTFNLPKQTHNYVAIAGMWSYETVAEAISNANGETVQILKDTDEAITISGDVIIDLAGYSLSNVSVSAGNLQLIDTVGGGSANVTGTVETFTEADGKNYLVVGENGVYSAHSYDVAITHISLAPANDALGYKAQVLGDEVVQAHVKSIGFNLWLDDGKVRTYEKEAANATLRLKNILKNNGGEMNINATAFVTLAIGEETVTKTGSQQTATMKQTMQMVNAEWAEYTQTQREAVKALCDKYYTTVSAWELDNIYCVAEDGAVNGVYEVVTGDVSYNTDGSLTTANNSLLLHTSVAFTEGTYAATMNPGGKNSVGIVFGADDAGMNYYLFRMTGNQTVELVKVENGVETVLSSGLLSLGHIYTLDTRLELVKNGNTVYCYFYNRFDKINCYEVTEVALFGDRVGLWATASGTVFKDVSVTNATQNRTAETLIFGHSYTEMWWDFETYFPEYTDIDDIGIGGSVASHWEALTDEVISYKPDLGIYNIGINDLTRGATPEDVIDSMEKALLEIKTALPEFEVVLVSVSHCPARSTITEAISQTNVLMGQLANKYDWMYYAEVEYLFCTDNTDPLSTNASLFIDGLHPTAEGYQMMAEVIKSAINDKIG